MGNSSRDEFQKKTIWVHDNLKVGQTIKFRETINKNGKPEVKDYRGIYLGFTDEKRSLHIQIAIYSKDTNTMDKKDFNIMNISDFAQSRLPKDVSDEIKRRYLIFDNQNFVLTIKKALGSIIIVRNFKENTFFLLNKELATITEKNYTPDRPYNLKLRGDVDLLNEKYSEFSDNLSVITNKDFKGFINDETLSINPYIISKKAGENKTTYFQATEITLNKSVTDRKKVKLLTMLKGLSNI